MAFSCFIKSVIAKSANRGMKDAKSVNQERAWKNHHHGREYPVRPAGSGKESPWERLRVQFEASVQELAR